MGWRFASVVGIGNSGSRVGLARIRTDLLAYCPPSRGAVVLGGGKPMYACPVQLPRIATGKPVHIPHLGGKVDVAG